MSRRYSPVPAYLESATNLHLISDPHCQPDVTARTRLNKVLADSRRMSGLSTIDARMVLGDLMGSPEQINADIWHEWSAGLSEAAQVLGVVGNHDIYDPRGPGIRDQTWLPSQAAQILGLPAANYITELGDIRIIVLAPTDDQYDVRWPLTLGPAELQFLDASLSSTTRPCVIAFHAPLSRTVGGLETLVGFSSWEDWVKVNSNPSGGDNELREILSSHANAMAFLSGHTHSPLESPGLISMVEFGSRNMVHINASGLWYTGRNNPMYAAHDPLCGLLFSILDEHTIEVRFRDHGNGVWTVPPGGEYQGRRVVALKV